LPWVLIQQRPCGVGAEDRGQRATRLRLIADEDRALQASPLICRAVVEGGQPPKSPDRHFAQRGDRRRSQRSHDVQPELRRHLTSNGPSVLPLGHTARS
jgi:hypothetical protein